MSAARVFYLLLRIEVPDVMGSSGEHPDDPIGFIPVFSSEAAARAHAGDRFAVQPIRVAAPRQAPQKPPRGSGETDGR